MAVWEQQENETPKAYAAFCVYRDMGQSRSVDAVAGRQEGGKRAAGLYWRWAAEYEWKRRAESYDAYLELTARKQREAEHIAELAAYRERARKAATDTAAIASAALLKAGRRLQSLDPEQIEPSALPAFLRAAADVMEKSINLEAEAIGVRRLEVLLDNADKEQGEG